LRAFEGKNAIVTGANRGLGKAIVKELAAQGCNVWAIYRHESEEFNCFASKLESEHSVFIKSITVDLASEESIKDGYRFISAEKKTIDILINNAGIGHMGLFQMTKTEFIRDLYAVNLFAPMILTQLVLRNMSRQKSGKIINVASTASSEVYEGNSIYGSSKAALVAFTQSLAAETFNNGVTVNAIAPGLINTDMSCVFEGKDPEEPIRHTALGRKIEAKEIADIVINLLSDKMKLINGAVVTINGGHK
jgi:3-oxoacyl-[acyl-carrier protein] reductase